MDISGKTKIWRKDIEGQNGTFYRYSTSVSSRREDGSYATVYVPVRFARRANAPEKISNGAEVDIKQGFLTVDEHPNRDGEKVRELMVMVMSAKFPNTEIEDAPDSFEQLVEDLPFN